jgi:two-component system, LytTR family, sensor kinase
MPEPNPNPTRIPPGAPSPLAEIAAARGSVGSSRSTTNWGLVWLFSIASWSVLWLLMCLQSLVYFRENQLPVPWIKFAAWFIEVAGLWGLASPVTLWYIWKRPLTRADWKKSLPYQVAGWIVIPALLTVPLQLARFVASHVMDAPELYSPLNLLSFSRLYLNAFLAYLDVLLAGLAIYYARDARSKQLRASKLEARLAEAQLDVLRMQLHPHFLFNTLNTVSALMHRDVQAADRMLALLGDLLRDSFEKISAQEVSLKQELGFLEKYLEIEKTRFRDRLSIETEIDPETLDAEVPNLMLQPLVENAIRHGIARRREAGHIRLMAWRDGDRLELRVRDNGPGLSSERDMVGRSGVGLSNTQARLRQLYGPAHRFELLAPESGGLEVALSIPFKLRSGPPRAVQAIEEGRRDSGKAAALPAAALP